MMFKEIHPCRTTGSQDRQTNRFIPIHITRQAIQYLGTFFHDGKVGGKVCIKYIIETQFAKSVHHLSRYQCPCRQPEFFSQSRTNGRSCLYNDYLIRIFQIQQQAVGMIAFCQCPYRTNSYTLSAISTFTVTHHLIESRSNRSIETTANSSQGTYCLYFIAYTLATAAEYTLIHIPHNGRSYFTLTRRKLPTIIRHPPDIETQRQSLQLTVAALRTGKAIIRMIRKYQFSYYLAGIHHAQGTSAHHHSFCTTGSTGGSQITTSFHLHDTDTARSRIILNASTLQINMTKGRYIYTDFPCGFQYSRAFGHGNIMAVYLQGYLFFFHFLSV